MQNTCTILYCHLWHAWLYNILLHYLVSGKIFVKKLLNIKCVLLFSLQLLSESSLIVRIIQGHTIENMNLGNIIPLCELIISNPIHVSITPKHYTFVYYYFLWFMFQLFIQRSSGRRHKYLLPLCTCLPHDGWTNNETLHR